MNDRLKIVISKEINDKIKYTCKRIPQIEWVGLIFYKKDDNKLIIDEFYPLTYGEVASVETNKKLEELGAFYRKKVYGDKPMDIYTGRIHSHNNMEVFFSGTDETDLRTFAKSDVILSIVTNNKNEFFGKIAFPYKNVFGFKQIISEEVDITVSDDINIDKEFIEIIDKIEKEHNEKKITVQNCINFGTNSIYKNQQKYNHIVLDDCGFEEDDISDLDDIELYKFEYVKKDLELSNFISHFGNIDPTLYFSAYDTISIYINYNNKLENFIKSLEKILFIKYPNKDTENVDLFNVIFYNKDFRNIVVSEINKITDVDFKNYVIEYLSINGIDINNKLWK